MILVRHQQQQENYQLPGLKVLSVHHCTTTSRAAAQSQDFVELSSHRFTKKDAGQTETGRGATSSPDGDHQLPAASFAGRPPRGELETGEEQGSDSSSESRGLQLRRLPVVLAVGLLPSGASRGSRTPPQTSHLLSLMICSHPRFKVCAQLLLEMSAVQRLSLTL